MAGAQVVTGQLNFNPVFSQTGVFGALASFTSNQQLPSFTSLQYQNTTSGVALFVDQLYAATLTFVASTAQTFHFGNASLIDPFGNTLSMLRIREFVILNTSGTAGWDLSVAQAASNGVTWLPVVANAPPHAYANGGIVRLSDPYSSGSGIGQVISSTTDGIVLTPTAHAVTAAILVLGASIL
jgi:hypothetical protein